MESPPLRRSDGDGDGDADASSSSLPYSSLPHDNRTYAQVEYWEERFAHEASYDWLTGYDGLKGALSPHMHLDDRILVIGCGNSGPLPHTAAPPAMTVPLTSAHLRLPSFRPLWLVSRAQCGPVPCGL